MRLEPCSVSSRTCLSVRARGVLGVATGVGHTDDVWNLKSKQVLQLLTAKARKRKIKIRNLLLRIPNCGHLTVEEILCWLNDSGETIHECVCRECGRVMEEGQP
jgi:hypothetical protein